ncbi:MAG: thiamine phosphate synthase [Gemmatimonadaceae bacterium]|nr:thiamine phosphate synthase [Gemmatimonadaceae bacterium]
MMEHSDPRLRLMAITDDLRDGTAGLVSRAIAAERGGATMVMLRLKHVDARVLVEVGSALVASLAIPVIVHERLDVALACRAAGVHLGASSMPVAAIRPHVAADFLIGGSVSSAVDVGGVLASDYVTVGPVFGAGEASVGLDGLRRLAASCGRPVLAIGGVDTAAALSVLAAGARGIAVIRAVLGAADPAAAAGALVGALRVRA